MSQIAVFGDGFAQAIMLRRRTSCPAETPISPWRRPRAVPEPCRTMGWRYPKSFDSLDGFHTDKSTRSRSIMSVGRSTTPVSSDSYANILVIGSDAEFLSPAVFRGDVLRVDAAFDSHFTAKRHLK